jgi:hypothetical protein
MDVQHPVCGHLPVQFVDDAPGQGLVFPVFVQRFGGPHRVGREEQRGGNRYYVNE